MSDLVRRLAQGTHPVEVSLRPDRSLDELNGSIERGYLHLRFTGTRGGTEIGVSIDQDCSDFRLADLDRGGGRFTVVGELALDGARVRCSAEIQLPEMTGVGALHILPRDHTPTG